MTKFYHLFLTFQLLSTMQFMEDYYYFSHCFKLAMVNLILFLVRVGF